MYRASSLCLLEISQSGKKILFLVAIWPSQEFSVFLQFFSFVLACIGPIKHVYKFELNISMRYGNIYVFPKGNVGRIAYQNAPCFYEGKMQYDITNYVVFKVFVMQTLTSSNGEEKNM